MNEWFLILSRSFKLDAIGRQNDVSEGSQVGASKLKLVELSLNPFLFPTYSVFGCSRHRALARPSHALLSSPTQASNLFETRGLDR